MFYIFKFNIFGFIKRKVIPRSLLSRFVLIIIIPTLIGQFFALQLFYERHWYNVAHHTSTLIVNEIESLLKSEEFLRDKNKEHKYINLSYVFLGNVVPLAYSDDNAHINLRDNHTIKTDIEELEIFKKSLGKQIHLPQIISIDDKGTIIVTLRINQDLLIITLPSKVLLNPTTYIFVLWVIFLTILLLSVSLIFSKNQIRSILDLTNAAENYGRGESMDNFKPSGAREIRRAGLAFIKMRDRIERQTVRRTQMLAMISHDLKTPLTRMKLQVELMNDSDEKEELNYDIQSMEYMISSYLDFARGEGGEDFKTIELSDWIQNYIKSFWSDHFITLNLKPRKFNVKLKAHSFARAMDNIISNATKYANKIKISMYSEKQNVVITIEDNGTGISESEKHLVFKPFYRGNKARTLESSNSVGLGLAITKEIIIGHYGNITLEKSKSLKGLKVKIKLPLIISFPS